MIAWKVSKSKGHRKQVQITPVVSSCKLGEVTKFVYSFQNTIRFQSIQHAVTKCDCQPYMDNGVVIMITGMLKVSELMGIHSLYIVNYTGN